MSDLQLYTFKLCPFAHRVRIALAEKSLRAAHIDIDLKNKPDSFKALSPTGRVPLLIHGEVKLWESAVILEYLDEAFPDVSLMPTDPAERAKVRLWIDFANSRLLPPTYRILFAKDAASRRELVDAIRASLRELEQGLADRRNGGPYLLGRQFTLADIAIYPWFEQSAALAQMGQFALPVDCPQTARWHTAVARRPAVRDCARADDAYVDGYRHYLAA